MADGQAMKLGRVASSTTYGKQAIAALLNFDWSNLGDYYNVCDDGIWVVPPSSYEDLPPMRSMAFQNSLVRIT